MPDDNTENQVNHVIGTTADDVITSENLDTDAGLTTFSSGDGTDATTGGDAEDGLLTDKINGNSGSDTIETGSGADLVAGDMVGDEWSFVDGKWVYDSSQIDTTSAPIVRDFDDLITTGDGDDVILGNGGDDTMYAGAGDDLINAGRGEDFSYGGDGADLLNLEDGDDYAEGGMGADVVNAGAGKDVVFGDVKGDNALTGASDGSKPTTMDGHGENGWNVTELDGQKSMTQTVDTSGSDTYSISFDLAANLSAGSTSGAVEVIWNGEVVGTIQTNTGAYQTHQIEVPSDADLGELSFREIPAEASGPVINTDGPVFSYTKEFEVGGVDVDVAAFAPGQAKLLQVIDGTLNVFDPITEEYLQVGDNTDLRVNAIGFNVEDDLIYGLALRDGVDHLGNAVSRSDLIMMDAEGNAYRVGETPVGDYVGDFDAEGNLWTFQSSVNSVTKIDVDNLDANGNPV
ncbi:MAG: calcium-binding protein, partial [Planktomarina sp.]